MLTAMTKKKKEQDKPCEIFLTEKHPMEEPPEPEETIISEEDLDKIPDEEQEAPPPYELPAPGEGP